MWVYVSVCVCECVRAYVCSRARVCVCCVRDSVFVECVRVWVWGVHACVWVMVCVVEASNFSCISFLCMLSLNAPLVRRVPLLQKCMFK